MKLGMTLRISILRRLVKEKSDSDKKWDIADFVTSPPAILVRKKMFENSSKIRLWSELQKTYTKDSNWTGLRDDYLGFLEFWVFDF